MTLREVIIGHLYVHLQNDTASLNTSIFIYYIQKTKLYILIFEKIGTSSPLS